MKNCSCKHTLEFSFYKPVKADSKDVDVAIVIYTFAITVTVTVRFLSLEIRPMNVSLPPWVQASLSTALRTYFQLEMKINNNFGGVHAREVLCLD